MLSLNQICISKLSAGLLHWPGAALFAYRTVRALPRATLDSSDCWVSLRAAELQMKFELKASPVLFFSRAKSEGGGRSRWWCVGSVGVRTHWAVRQIAGLVGEKRLSKRMRDQWTRTSDGILSALTKGYVQVPSSCLLCAIFSECRFNKANWSKLVYFVLDIFCNFSVKLLIT